MKFSDFISLLLPEIHEESELFYLTYAGDRFKNFEVILPDKDIFKAFLFENSLYLNSAYKLVKTKLPDNFEDIFGDITSTANESTTTSKGSSTSGNAGFNASDIYVNGTSDSSGSGVANGTNKSYNYYKTLLIFADSNITNLFQKMNKQLIKSFLQILY